MGLNNPLPSSLKSECKKAGAPIYLQHLTTSTNLGLLRRPETSLRTRQGKYRLNRSNR